MGKSVEYYLSKGYDRKMAEYFASGRKRITKVVPRNDFTLVLSFDNGEIRLYDARPLLQAGTVFAPFREWNNFRRVYLDEDHSVCWDIDPNVDSNEVWNNKVDLCPDSCYVDSVPFHWDSMLKSRCYIAAGFTFAFSPFVPCIFSESG